MANISVHLKDAFPLGKLSKNARLFLTATIIDGIINSTWSLYLNFFILSRGYDKEFLGLANAMPAIATLILGLPLGMLSDRIGRRKAMLLGLLIASAGYMLEVIAPTSWLILVGGFVGGAGGALYYNSQAPFMMKSSTSETRALLFSLSSGIITLSGAVGSLVAGKLPQVLSGITGYAQNGPQVLKIIMIAAVAVATLSLIPISLIREEREIATKAESSKPHADLKGLMAKPMLWKIALPNALTGIGAGILIPYINVFYAERFQLVDSQLGVLFSLSSLLVGVGSLIGPRLSVLMHGKIRTVVLTQGLSFVFLVLMGFTPFGWLSQGSYLLRTMLMNMAQPLLSAFAMEQFSPGEQGAANSIFSISWTLGWAFGPYVSGIIQLRNGFNPLFIMTTILYFVATALIWLFFGVSEKKSGVSLAQSVEETKRIPVE